MLQSLPVHLSKNHENCMTNKNGPLLIIMILDESDNESPH